MKTRRTYSSILAWSLWAVVTGVTLLSLAGTLASRTVGENMSTLLQDLLWALTAILFAFLAAVIVTRQPRNPIGWLPSPRWRWVLLFGLLLIAIFILILLFLPVLTLLENEEWAVSNPIGILPADFVPSIGAWGIGVALLTLLCGSAPSKSKYSRKASRFGCRNTADRMIRATRALASALTALLFAVIGSDRRPALVLRDF